MRIKLAIGVVLALIVQAPPAVATFPGANGKFVFSTYDTELDQLEVCTENPNGTGRSCFAGSVNDSSSGWSSSGLKLAITGWAAGSLVDDVFTVDPDGSNRFNVTSNPASDFDGAFAPGPFTIGWTSQRDGNLEIYSGSVGGGFTQRLTNNPAADAEPAWSSFRTLAFTSDRDGNENVYTMNENQPDLGSDLEQLTNDPASDSSPNWSPDGSRIAFVSTRDGNPEIYSMAADGTDEVRLTSTPTVREAEPVWSPDGTKIAFLTEPCVGFACDNKAIWQMDPDGTDRELLIGYEGTRFVYGGLDWQPLPVETTSIYVRPKGATPFRAALVPAAHPCTSPNRQHGPPLAFGSCAPVQPTSPNLTVGTGGGGTSPPAKSIGSLQLDVQPGVPGPPHDTQILIAFSLTNIMTEPSHVDYTGKLRVRMGLRITDREPAYAGGPAKASTSVDLPFEFDVTCTATADTTLGASCVSNTSSLAVMPGWPAEGSRQLWAINSVQVFDGGPDGDPETESGNSLFMTQGIFVP